MKARFITLAILLLGLAGAAIWWESAILMAMCVIIFLLIIAGIVINRFSAERIDVQLMLSENSENFGGIDVLVRLANRSHLPLLKGVVAISVQNLNFKIGLEKQEGISLKAGEEKDYTFHIESSYCGKYLITVDHVRCFDIWGLSYKDICRKTENVTFLFPGNLFVNRVTEAIRQNYEKERKFAGKKNSILSEILQYKEYQKGDSLKHVNWKLSAKYDQMYVREFDTPVDNKTLIIFDLFDGDIDYQNLTYQVLFSVCLTFIRSRLSFQLCWQENNILKYQVVERIEDLFFVMRCIMSDERHGSLSAMVLFEGRDIPGKYAKIIYISNREIDKKDDRYGMYECISVNEDTFRLDDYEAAIKRIEA